MYLAIFGRLIAGTGGKTQIDIVNIGSSCTSPCILLNKVVTKIAQTGTRNKRKVKVTAGRLLVIKKMFIDKQIQQITNSMPFFDNEFKYVDEEKVTFYW